MAALVVVFSGAQAKKIALAAAILEFAYSVCFYFRFVPENGTQFMFSQSWIPQLGISFKVGMDGISLLLVLLTTFLVPLIILSSFRREYKSPGLFYGLILMMQFALIGVFVSLDAFLFYIFW